ncbi:MAG: molybdopterin-dependent oxidoreductase [Acidimicrobiales bacterium]
MTGTTTAYRTCPLCEAGCGLELTMTDGAVTRIRGDRADVFSHGFICPKGSALIPLHEDPDRIRTPLVRRNGVLEPATWAEAFDEIDTRLTAIIADHGRDAVAVYLGNPGAHNLGNLLYGSRFVRALGTTNVYSASTVDQRPKEITNALMYGGALSGAVPDIDRTDFLMILGANPFASNGSLATAPDWPARLRAIRARGGKVIVIDPRRTKTAEEADEHFPIRPGTDPLLLAAMVHTLFAEDLVRLGAAEGFVVGVDEVRVAVAPFAPDAVAAVCGVDADVIRRLARELAAAPSAAVYGRIGTSTAEFGTLASWLVDVCNVVTGNLDRAGGVMFTRAAAGASNTRGTPRVGRGVRLGRRTSRVRGLAESFGELPVVALAEEIETPGDGQVRALCTIAGNPVVSTPNGGRLDAALSTLEFMVSLDIYLNETTRHADVILPAPSALQKSHYDVALLQLAIRNVANYSAAVLPLDDGAPDEWEILAKLALIAAGQSSDADPSVLDDEIIHSMVVGAVADELSPVHGRDPDEILGLLGPRTGPERILDLMLRSGPYGDGFGTDPGGLSLAVLEANPHGIDLGPLEPRLPEVLRTPSGMVELAPEILLADLPRLARRLAAGVGGPGSGEMVLIGRRDLRSCNSWMHNVGVLVKGKQRCTAQISPGDAARLGLSTGDAAQVTSRTGSVVVPVEVTDAVMPGVVSIPHGWGHDLDGIDMATAEAHPGVNSNLVADELLIDPVSGNAVLNGIPVTIGPVSGERGAAAQLTRA